MTPPADTPEMFEKYLPYAIALGVENRWAERFAGVLAAAAAQGQQGFAWYAGSGSPWNNPGGFADSVGSSLSSTISSASTAPGSSSGRAAADPPAAVAAAVAAVAGSAPQAGRGADSVGSS